MGVQEIQVGLFILAGVALAAVAIVVVVTIVAGLIRGGTATQKQRRQGREDPPDDTIRS